MTSFLSSKQFAFLTIGLLSIPALSPLLPAGFVSTHDGIMHLYRVLELDRTLRSGILYPRWAPDLAYGYGYPIFNFYAPLALYIVEAFHLAFGLGFLPATKLTLGAGLVLSGLSMYLLMVELFEEKSQLKLAAILASLAYIYAPYHLIDIYVRGGVSQSLAFVPMPLILWAFLKFVKVRKFHYLILSALFLASLICVHQIIAFFSCLSFLPLAFG